MPFTDGAASVPARHLASITSRHGDARRSRPRRSWGVLPSQAFEQAVRRARALPLAHERLHSLLFLRVVLKWVLIRVTTFVERSGAVSLDSSINERKPP